MVNDLDLMELSEISNLDNISVDEKKKFRITDINSANWVFRKIRSIDAKISDVKALSNKEKLRIDSWEEKQIKSLDNTREFFQGLITEYVMTEKVKDKNFKLSTPYGMAYIKKATDKWIYDEEALKKWLKENKPDLIVTDESIDKKSLKNYYKTIAAGKIVDLDTGQIVDGISIIEGENTVIITLNNDEKAES